jgi:Protein of unknown function (DUF2510)
VSNSSLPPAGWFPDPGGNIGLLRYWDGTTWTDHTQPIVSAIAPPEVTSALNNANEFTAAADEYGDRILFHERTLGAAKSLVTITANRCTVAKRSIAFVDVEQLAVDSTQLLSFGIKNGLSHTIAMKGRGTKSVGLTTQNLPMRSGREHADVQFEMICALLEEHLVPGLLRRLHLQIMAGEETQIGSATLSREGVKMGRSFIRWSEYCGTVEEGRSVQILGPTPNDKCGTTFVRFPNVRLLSRLCDLCAKY